jgi:hypothetical protein
MKSIIAALLMYIHLIICVASGQTATAAQKTTSNNQLCKAGIAALMGRNPGTIKINRVKNDVIYLSYRRPDDGKDWRYKCKIQGNRIMWGADDGRWRDHLWTKG